MLNKKSTYETEVFAPWCYVYATYGSEDQLPLLVVLQNCSQVKGDVRIERILVDDALKTVTLATNQGTIEISERNQWTIKLGKTNAGHGQVIFTHHIE